MPISFWLYMVGGFSISGFPLFNGFISKGMTIEAAELIQNPIIYLLLEGATVGTFLHTGLKLPWNIWLQGREEPPAAIRSKLKDSALNTPVHMLVGMGILAFLCVFMGVYPRILYEMLPYPVEYVPFTLTRVFSITQMFLFTFLGFWLLRALVRGYPAFVLDTDWLVRMPGGLLVRVCKERLTAFGEFLDRQVLKGSHAFITSIRSPNIEMKMTPIAVGSGIVVTILLFFIFSISRL
jgi:multicomponent Na+:H+ antiporter subunit D